MALALRFCAGIALVLLTLAMQSAGMAALVLWARVHLAKGIHRFGLVGAAVLVVRSTSLIVCLHMSEILLWACFFRWKCFPSWGSAFYFSASSYSTVGYGDLILPPTWRAVGPVESLTGVLMCGVSASLLFAIVTRLVERDEEKELAKAIRPSGIPAIPKRPDTQYRLAERVETESKEDNRTDTAITQ
jgi:voltage-gated potassium channel